MIFAGILRGSASNFDLSGGACGRGALRRGGALFEKSSAKTFFGRFAVLDMEIAKSFWFSSRSREENAAQAIEKGKENEFSFPCTMAWADRESPSVILCQQNDAKSVQTPSQKVLGGVGTFF